MNFQDAVNAQNNGDLKLADKIYKKILAQQSNNFEILFNYAVLNFNLIIIGIKTKGFFTNFFSYFCF